MYIFLACVILIGYISGCSLPPGQAWPVFTMEETLETAPMVVTGRDVYHAPPGQDGYRNYTFQVSCVFKSGCKNIPRTIFLLDVGAISCDGTHMEVGQSYVLAIRRATVKEITRHDVNKDYFGKDAKVPLYFKVHEPGLLATAAFNATNENLMKTSKLCVDVSFDGCCSPRCFYSVSSQWYQCHQ